MRLCRNQTQAGYSVVIAKRHAPELHHLTHEERCGFWNDVAKVGEVIYELFNPVKLANLSMGFRMPHFHCHVLPQYQDDDPFGMLNPRTEICASPKRNGPSESRRFEKRFFEVTAERLGYQLRSGPAVLVDDVMNIVEVARLLRLASGARQRPIRTGTPRRTHPGPGAARRRLTSNHA